MYLSDNIFSLTVSRLRSHWEDTSGTVLGRRTQLDAMLADSHRLEGRRAEVADWLSRMEVRCERASHQEAPDAAMREHKVGHWLELCY